MDAVTKIVNEIYRPSCGFSLRNVENWVERVANAADEAGYTICDLKPLAELLGCEPVIEHISELIANRQTWVSQHVVGQLVAQALNWDRTEFDTLDELSEELRQWAAVHAALVEIRTERDAADPAGCEAFMVLHEVCRRIGLPPMGFEGLAARLRSTTSSDVTHTLLHAGELYREVTVLLHTEQLVAWRTADGQEYSAKAHQVLFDPDEDGLAAAILSRIAGVEIAPEHMAELRAQMGVNHG